MSRQILIEEIEEYEEYYEEEVLSYYDGLSTIIEEDNESYTSSQSDTPELQNSNSPIQNRSPRRIPDHISLTPRRSNSPRWGLSLDSSPQNLSMASPGLFSPMSQARKFSLKSPLVGYRKRGSPSAAGANCSIVDSIPLLLTSLETGEELVMDDDDDEFTFVSCSDTESILGASLSNMEESFESLSIVDASCSLSSSRLSNLPSDFEAARERLEHALKRRRKEEKMGLERMDYAHRKLRYDLQRKMFKEKMARCIVPSKRRNDQ